LPVAKRIHSPRSCSCLCLQDLLGYTVFFPVWERNNENSNQDSIALEDKILAYIISYVLHLSCSQDERPEVDSVIETADHDTIGDSTFTGNIREDSSSGAIASERKAGG